MKNRINSFEVGENISRLEQVILSHWEGLVREVITSSQHESSIILLDHIPDLITQLIGILRSGEVSEIELGKSHGFQRAILTQYSVGDVQTEFSLLRETLIHYLYPMADKNSAKLVHKFLDILGKHSVVEFIKDQDLKKSLVHQEIIGNEIQELEDNPII